ncbi:hypothetical protein CLV36_101407 [Laceyella sediminis]|jgi:hypothetical protein|uniref:Uncharacterized protein n=2 Tax=Thermoactinomycetaceae TaxID=186824 RepID=A0ABX5ETK5_9BACL|nr:hypothetical protein CLV36_101407 [Laceyella sediminis]
MNGQLLKESEEMQTISITEAYITVLVGVVGAVSALFGAWIGGKMAGVEQRKTEIYKEKRKLLTELSVSYKKYINYLTSLHEEDLIIGGGTTENKWKDISKLRKPLMDHFNECMTSYTLCDHLLDGMGQVAEK